MLLVESYERSRCFWSRGQEVVGRRRKYRASSDRERLVSKRKISILFYYIRQVLSGIFPPVFHRRIILIHWLQFKLRRSFKFFTVRVDRNNLDECFSPVSFLCFSLIISSDWFSKVFANIEITNIIRSNRNMEREEKRPMWNWRPMFVLVSLPTVRNLPRNDNRAIR